MTTTQKLLTALLQTLLNGRGWPETIRGVSKCGKWVCLARNGPSGRNSRVVVPVETVLND